MNVYYVCTSITYHNYVSDTNTDFGNNNKTYDAVLIKEDLHIY